jgi:CubicO group peptidase (beta-lactamase class C family)
VTLANWRVSPFSRWAFQHVREIVPTADIPNDPAGVAELAADPVDLGALSIGSDRGEPLTLREVLDETATDGLVVLHRGRIAFEHHAAWMAPGAPHILMSVSKSLLGLLAGVLMSRGDLRADRLVAEILPEMAGTAYAGASIRHLLDMRAGVAFDEDYLAASGPMIAYRKAGGFQPPDPGDPPSDLRSFLGTLTSGGPHGGAVHYVSPNTELLGWVIERATGQPCADLLSELLWRPLGAERSAYIAVDRLGTPRCAGGICATVRDLARVGHLIAQGGARGGAQIVPEACIEDIATSGDGDAWAAGDLAPYFPGEPVRYRSQWYVYGGQVIFGLGIHGQSLHVHRKHGTVIARVSSEALPIDPSRGALIARAIARVMRFFAGAAR